MRLKSVVSLLCAIGLLFSGCASGSPPVFGGEKGETPQAKGRYLEKEIHFPSEAQQVYDIRQEASGELEIFCNLDMAESLYQGYRSKDQGKTWEKYTPPWQTALEEQKIGVDYGIYLKDRFFASGYGEDNESKEYIFYDDGTMKAFEEPFASESGAGVNGVREAENGDLVYCHYFQLLQRDPEGNLKYTYEADNPSFQGNQGSYTLYGNQMAVARDDSIQIYDLETGEALETIEQDSLERVYKTFTGMGMAKRVITVSEEENAFYYCDQTGIYRRMLDGSISERLANGELTSLSMPTISLERLLLQPNGDLLVWAYNNETPVLLQYHYDPEAPVVPNTELRIFSLHGNKTIRQAIGMFQRENPDVKLTYEVGVTEENQSSADAIRTFHTKLLAGDGPDIIVLDGLPINSYIKKGILADLTGSQSETVKGMLPNIAASFQKEKGLYALPCRFSVLMAALGPEGPGKGTTLEQLTAWLEQQPDSSIYCSMPEILLRTFAPLLAVDWFQEDGSVNREGFLKSLTLLERLSKQKGAQNYAYTYDEDRESVLDLEFSAVGFAGKGVTADLGPLTKIRSATAAKAALDRLGGGSFFPLAGEKGSVFTPAAILSINAATKQPELAGKFISFALSPEVLSYDLEDGLASNRTALLKSMESPFPEDGGATYYVMSIMVVDEEGQEEYVPYELRAPWPADKTFLPNLVADLEEVKIPSIVDEALLEIAMEKANGYFEGNGTLEEEADEFAKKAGLYLAEME